MGWVKYNKTKVFFLGKELLNNSIHCGLRSCRWSQRTLRGNQIKLLLEKGKWKNQTAIVRQNARKWWLKCSGVFVAQFGTDTVVSMEKAMAPHSSTLAWKIPWMEEPGGLQSMGSRGVGHDWATSLSRFTFIHWRRKWQPTPVFLPGESQGWGSLVGCCLWGRTESDTTEAI